ncbi:MAG: aromatic ring-hydroxylating dioxygenase subunit alpha [Bradymonadales bacterium]|nr:MAG: aromatic ring-hydroxylating dioxygenase subunit alpha [Bradymonadales bacterium]
MLDQKLLEGWTLPSEAYLSEAFAQWEFEELWPRAWSLLGDSSVLKEPRSYRCYDFFGESLVLIRDSQNEMRLLSNVCRHRAGPIFKKQQARYKSLTCQYHAWSYKESGELLRAPEMGQAKNFKLSDYCLPRFPLERWGPLLFSRLREGTSFKDWLGEISSEVPPELLSRLEYRERRDYSVRCNWKLYVDNYLEGYHLRSVHPRLSRELDYEAYRSETRAWHSRQWAPTRQESNIYTEGQSPEAHYYWLFPHLMLNLYQGILQTNVVEPVGIDECRVRFDWWAIPEVSAKRLEELIGFSEEIQEEDREICEWVQKNLRSRFYRQGRYSPTRENALHHFHQLIESIKKQIS